MPRTSLEGLQSTVTALPCTDYKTDTNNLATATTHEASCKVTLLKQLFVLWNLLEYLSARSLSVPMLYFEEGKPRI